MSDKMLNPEVHEGRVKILKAGLYMEHQVVVRMIGDDYFEYLISFGGQIYSSYIIIKPRENQEKLSEDDIAQCRDLAWASAETTLDSLLGIDTVDEKTKEYLELFEANREKVEKELEKEDGKK